VCKEGCKWSGIAHKLRPGFWTLGDSVGARPLLSILISLGITLLCCLGLLKFEVAYGHQPWFDESTPSYQDFFGTALKLWPDDSAYTRMVIQALPGPNNTQGILAPGCLEAVGTLRAQVVGKLLPAACGRSNGNCESSIFRVLGDNQIDESDAPRFLSKMWMGSGLPYSLRSVVGGSCCGPNITHASALKIHFHSLVRQADSTTLFNSEMVRVCSEWKPSSTTRHSCPSLELPHCYTSQSVEWEQERTAVEDHPLLLWAILLMLVYVPCVIGRAANCVHSKVLLGASVLLPVGCSLAVSFGVGSVCGVRYSSLSFLTIYILLGAGVDDAFIINDAFERTDKQIQSKTRLALALEDVGPSILLTSATDFAAFIVGASFPVEAFRGFCIFTAIAMAAVFVFQVSFFCALLVLDAERQRARRFDVCPCLPLKIKDAHQVAQTEHEKGCAHARPADPDENQDMDVGSGYQHATPQRSPSTRAPWFCTCGCHPIVITLTLLCFTGLLAFSLLFIATKRTKGLSLDDIVGRDSYVLDYLKVSEENFGEERRLGVFTTPLDLGNQKQLHLLHSIIHALEALPAIPHDPTSATWVDAYLAWRANASLTAAAHGSNASSFLASAQGAPFRDDIIPIQGNLVNSRAWLLIRRPSKDEDQLQLVKDVRRTYDGINKGELPGFVWSDFFIIAERYGHIDRHLLTSQVWALVAVGSVSVLMLPFHVAGISFICVALVNINVMGFMSLWGVKISVTTAAVLVICMGFSVDYTAHIAEALSARFLKESSGTKKDPVGVAFGVLKTTGISVMHGGTSTLLAVLMLSFSKLPLFQDLFKGLLLMVIFGLVHGLVFVPMLFVSLMRIVR